MKLILQCFLIMLVVICPIGVLAETTIPGQYLASTTIVSAKKTWQLTFKIQPSVPFVLIINGHEVNQEAAVLQLYKQPEFVLGSKLNPPPKLIWILTKAFLPGTPPKTWLGNICADNKTSQLYVAVSDGYGLEIYMTDLNDVVQPVPLKGKWTLVPPEVPSHPRMTQKIIGFPINDFLQLGKIDHMSFVKRDSNLIITLGNGNLIPQQWSYSLTTREWQLLKSSR